VTFRGHIQWVATAAGAAAALSVLPALPRGSVAGAGFSFLALLPVTLVCCSLLLAAPQLLSEAQVVRVRRAAAYGPRAFAGLVVFGLGALGANLALADAAFQTRPLGAYAALAVAATVTLWRSGRSRHFSEHSEARLSTPTVAGLAGLGLGIFDTHFYPHTYSRLHVSLLILTVLLFCVATSSWVRGRTRLRWESALVGTSALMLCLGYAWPTASQTHRDMLRSATSQQRLLLAAQWLLDRDGDGFASRLSGGDCDDRARKAFPLSFESDCLGWAQRAPQMPARVAWPEPATRAASAPEIIVLLTIDAFRCGFERAEPLPALRSACPELTRLGKSGRLRLDAYTTFPRTDEAMGSLNTGAFRYAPKSKDNRYLADWLENAGYHTHAISTAGNQFPGKVQQSFESVDLSLRRLGAAGTRADAVTSRVLEAIQKRSPERPLFIWAHYFDAHAPYVTKPGSAWAIGSDQERYAGEIRRVDAAIGRLAKGLSQRPEAERIVMFVTADHGEEFGDKGAQYHGFSLADEAIRIPMLVWSPSSTRLAATPAQLPGSIAEVGGYLTAVVTGIPFESRGEAFFSARTPNNVSLGLYRAGWKLIHQQDFGFSELYDLSSDASERSDLSERRVEKRNELGPRLAGYARPGGGEKLDRGD
jgi:hypothetical protein